MKKITYSRELYKAILNQSYFDYLFTLNQSVLGPFGANCKALRKYGRIPTSSIKEVIQAKGFYIREDTIREIERGVRTTVSVTYLSAIADYFGLTVWDMIVSDYSKFDNIPERVLMTFGMSVENVSKSILQSRPKRGKYKVRKKRIV